MKFALFIVFPVLFLTISGCGEKKREPCVGSFEMIWRDTVNMADCKGRKQGKWIPRKGIHGNGLTDTVYYRNDTIIPKP